MHLFIARLLDSENMCPPVAVRYSTNAEYMSVEDFSTFLESEQSVRAFPYFSCSVLDFNAFHNLIID